MTSQLSLIYTTFSSKEDALNISQRLLEMHLIACANISAEIQSLFLTAGKLEKTEEISVLYKTTAETIPKLMTALSELHPYEIPVILEIPIKCANDTFENWVKNGIW